MNSVRQHTEKHSSGLRGIASRSPDQIWPI